MEFPSVFHSMPTDSPRPGDKQESGKTPLYIAKRGHDLWRSWVGAATTSMPGGFYSGPTWAQWNRDFSRGLQDNTDYIKPYQLNEDKPNDAAVKLQIPYTASNFQVKVMDVIGRFLSDMDTVFTATAEDPTSVDERTMARFEMIAGARMSTDPMLAEADAMMANVTGIQGMVNRPGMPRNEHEVDVYIALGPKDAQTTALSLAVELLKQRAGYYTGFRTSCANEMRDTSIAIAYVYLGPDGMPKLKYVRIEDAMLPHDIDGNFNNMPYGGFVDFMDPDSIFHEIASAGDVREPEKLLKQLKELAGRNDGRTWSFGTGTSRFTVANTRRGKVPVMRFFYKEPDGFYYSTRQDKDGNTVHRTGKVDSKKWNVKEASYECVYTGAWVIGSPAPGSDNGNLDDRSIYWGCGKLGFQPRNGTAGPDGRSPSPDGGYTAWVPMVAKAFRCTNMRAKAIAELCKDRIHEIEMLSLEIRKWIVNIIPPGLGYFDPDAILSAMESIDMPREKKVSMGLKMFKQIGAIAGTREPTVTDQGVVIPAQPIVPQDGQIGEFEKLINAIEVFKAWLYEVIGVNDATLGNTTDSKTLVGNQKIQIQGTGNAQGALYGVWKDFEVEVAMLLFRSFRTSLANGIVLEGSVQDLFGLPGSKWIKFTRNDDPGHIGIKVEMRFSDEDKIMINDACQKAVASGQITIPDLMMITSIRNRGLAMAILKNRIDEYGEKNHQRQLEIQQAVGQAQQGTADVQNQGKLATEQARSQARLEEARMKTEAAANDSMSKLEANMMMAQFMEDQKRMMQQMQMQHEQLMARIEIASRERMTMLGIESAERIAESSNEAKKEIAEEAAEARESNGDSED